ncbi:glycosyltransferase family 4 protein [Pseudomonadota bacterium]
MLRVAYVSLFSDMVGGGEHSLMELLGHLPDSITGELIMPADGELGLLARGGGLSVHYLPMPKLGMASIQALWQWRKWIQQHSYDVVHANQSRAAFYAGVAALGLNTKMVFHCRIAAKDGMMDTVLQWLSDAIICNSRAVAGRFTHFSGSLKVIYNGVTQKRAVEESSPDLPEDAKLLLFVGRLSSEKQPQRALQLFENIAGKHTNLHFAMVGGDDPQDMQFSQAVREKAASSSFAERIHLPGAVNSVAAWYQRAFALVLTSKHEGFGRVLVEAMAEGVVPIAFSVGGVPEVFEHGEHGFLVHPDDLESMLDHVDELLGDNSLRDRLAEKGKSRAGLFSIENHVASVESLYQEILCYA